MDDASLAALRSTVSVGLEDARREFARCQDELAERRVALDAHAPARATLLTQQARWNDRLQTLSGHTLTAREMLDFYDRGAAIAARLEAATRRLEEARRALERASERLDEARRVVGEQLARLRWIDAESRRGDEARERRAEEREDED